MRETLEGDYLEKVRLNDIIDRPIHQYHGILKVFSHSKEGAFNGLPIGWCLL